MKTSNQEKHRNTNCFIFAWLAVVLLFAAHAAQAVPLSLADSPLFLSKTATPLVMLNISKDHQLYFKAYDDFSDINGDGAPDTTYNNSISYYGYFDSSKCYNYNTSTNRFEPYSLMVNSYCSGYWSGNFLNWATMSRIDAVRKILYGGLRSIDTGTTSALQTVGPTTTAPVTSSPVAGTTSAPGAYTLAASISPSGPVTALTSTTGPTASISNSSSTDSATGNPTTGTVSGAASCPSSSSTTPSPASPSYSNTAGPTTSVTTSALSAAPTVPQTITPGSSSTSIPGNIAATNSASVSTTPVNSTPVTVQGVSALGPISTTSFNTSYNTTYTTTTPVSSATATYTRTYSTTSTTTTPQSATQTYTATNITNCTPHTTTHNHVTTTTYSYTTSAQPHTITLTQNSNSTTINNYTNTYTNYYVAYTTTPFTSTTTTTTTTITGPTPGVTVLERSYIPNDGHSFAKYYSGADLPQLTPFSSAQTAHGVTLCNTTVSSNTFSQNVTDPPLIRVAAGNFMLWNANERWQCRWIGEENTYNNQAGAPNDNATIFGGANPPAGTPPNKTNNGLGLGDYIARVQVCNTNLIGNESCKPYSSGSLTTFKPYGLLQQYGDSNQLYFGLLTGSYGKNKSGGVLRKNVSSMNNEINIGTDGTFIASPSGGGIIDTLNRLRMYGYKHTDGTYFINGSNPVSTSSSMDGSANCVWGLTTFPDGSCSNWGNPQAEMYLESLRYLAGFGASSTYLPASPNLDSAYISGLNVATTSVNASNPTLIPTAQWCANQSLINFNASSISYDGDQLTGISDLGQASVSPLTNSVGTGENIPGNNYFVGSNGTLNDQLCTAKTVSSLSSVSGVCPDAPRLSGTYQIDGLAWFGHTIDQISSLQGSQTVTTYGVALAPKLPVITVPAPGSTTNNVTIVPACQDSSLPGNCTQTDFKIITQISAQTVSGSSPGNCQALSNTSAPSGTYNCGTLYVNWEDSEQGGDFDMDMWGLLYYAVSSKTVYISTRTVYQSTPYAMGFGYAISGTTKDGFHAHSGINGYNYTDANPGTLLAGNHANCSDCLYNDSATTVSYPIGSASASALQQPLWYAAKWGGFVDYNHTGSPSATADWDANGDGIPDTYYYATNPASLASSLAKAFNQVIGAVAAASSAAANTGNLQTGTVLYQAQFNSSNWSGHLYDISLLAPSGALSSTPNWDAATLLPATTSRNIFTYNGSVGAPFQWPSGSVPTSTTLSAAQMQTLETSFSGVLGATTTGQQRLNWIRGDQSNEVQNGGYLRNRSDLLGDIINSNPVYTQAESYGYNSLPTTAPEQASYATYVASKATRTPMLYDGANDGMLHGFHANTGVEQFAYVPAAVYGNLSLLTDPQYTHKYFVDGTVSIGDAYLTENGSTNWRTVLLSGLNKGGQAILALDVSNPTAFSASNVLWEYSGSTSTDTGSTGVIDANGLGYTYAQPQVARMHDGSWVAIFGNGYDSVSGQAFLYIVDLNTGVLVKKIPTNSAVGNGLSTAVLYDYDGDSIIDYAYAGDLQGNLWKFDLRAASSSGWALGNGGQPLFTAVNSNNQIQPITSKPLLALNPMGGWMVYFGTGEYVTNADVTNTNIQAFYAIWDKPSNTGTVALSSLVQQTITETVNSGTTNPQVVCSSGTSCNNTYTNSYRSVSGFTVNANSLGWYINLTSGERVRSAPVYINGLILFLTTIPSNDPCNPGGTSWLMEVDYLSGGAPGVSPFDLNNDGKINKSDTLPDGAIAAGVQSTVGMVAGTVLVGTSTTTTNKYNYGSTSQTQVVTNYSAAKSGTVNRSYWLQVQ